MVVTAVPPLTPAQARLLANTQARELQKLRDQPAKDEEIRVLREKLTTTHGVILTKLREVAHHVRHAGDCLIALKAAIGRGNWDAWKKAGNLPFKKATTENYMRVARDWDKVEPLLADNPDITLTDILKALAEQPKEDPIALAKHLRAKLLTACRIELEKTDLETLRLLHDWPFDIVRNMFARLRDDVDPLLTALTGVTAQPDWQGSCEDPAINRALYSALTTDMAGTRSLSLAQARWLVDALDQPGLSADEWLTACRLSEHVARMQDRQAARRLPSLATMHWLADVPSGDGTDDDDRAAAECAAERAAEENEEEHAAQLAAEAAATAHLQEPKRAKPWPGMKLCKTAKLRSRHQRGVLSDSQHYFAGKRLERRLRRQRI